MFCFFISGVGSSLMRKSQSLIILPWGGINSNPQGKMSYFEWYVVVKLPTCSCFFWWDRISISSSTKPFWVWSAPKKTSERFSPPITTARSQEASRVRPRVWNPWCNHSDEPAQEKDCFFLSKNALVFPVHLWTDSALLDPAPPLNVCLCTLHLLLMSYVLMSSHSHIYLLKSSFKGKTPFYFNKTVFISLFFVVEIQPLFFHTDIQRKGQNQSWILGKK